MPSASIALAHAVGDAQRGQVRVGDQQRALHAEAGELPAGVVHGAGAELDGGGLEGEHGLVGGGHVG